MGTAGTRNWKKAPPQIIFNNPRSGIKPESAPDSNIRYEIKSATIKEHQHIHVKCVIVFHTFRQKETHLLCSVCDITFEKCSVLAKNAQRG